MTRSIEPRQTDDVAERLAWERAAIDEAREDIRLGHAIADDEVDSWLDRFVNGPDPLPTPAQPREMTSDA